MKSILGFLQVCDRLFSDISPPWADSKTGPNEKSSDQKSVYGSYQKKNSANFQNSLWFMRYRQLRSVHSRMQKESDTLDSIGMLWCHISAGGLVENPMLPSLSPGFDSRPAHPLLTAC